MTDKEMWKLVEDFGNSTGLARGGNIKVRRNANTLHLSPAKKGDSETFKYEEGKLLGDLLQGAEHFLYWVRREKLTIKG